MTVYADFHESIAYVQSEQLPRLYQAGVEKLYCNDPKFSAWANSADPDQTVQGLHCLQFHLHLLEALLYGKA